MKKSGWLAGNNGIINTSSNRREENKVENKQNNNLAINNDNDKDTLKDNSNDSNDEEGQDKTTRSAANQYIHEPEIRAEGALGGDRECAS